MKKTKQKKTNKIAPPPPKKQETNKNRKKNFNNKCSIMFFTYNLAMLFDRSTLALYDLSKFLFCFCRPLIRISLIFTSSEDDCSCFFDGGHACFINRSLYDVHASRFNLTVKFSFQLTCVECQNFNIDIQDKFLVSILQEPGMHKL